MNKTVIITGVSSGIGKACCDKFISNGWNIIGGSRSRPQISGQQFTWIPVDYRDKQAIKEFCDICVSKTPDGIDAVVSCVGSITPDLHSPIDIYCDRMADELQVNLVGHMILGKLLSPAIMNKSGCFVWISSVATTRYYEGLTPYAVAKAGLEVYSRYLAAQLAPSKARSVTVRPAVVDTPLFQRSGIKKEDADKWHPLGRIGSSAEIAEAIAYLVSDRASWITGSDLTLDGGMTSLCGI